MPKLRACLIRERGNGCWQVRRQARVVVELPQSCGGQQDERNVEVICQYTAARVQHLDHQHVVRCVLQPAITNTANMSTSNQNHFMTYFVLLSLTSQCLQCYNRP